MYRFRWVAQPSAVEVWVSLDENEGVVKVHFAAAVIVFTAPLPERLEDQSSGSLTVNQFPERRAKSQFPRIPFLGMWRRVVPLILRITDNRHNLPIQ